MRKKPVVFVCKQWTLKVYPDNTYEIVNPGKDGELQFYKVVPGQYGQPLIVQEPTFGLPVPTHLKFVAADNQAVVPATGWTISGVICKDKGDVVHRFSLSNPKSPQCIPRAGGEIEVAGEKWYLQVLFVKDRNRTVNYDGFYGRKKPLAVRIVELADLFPA